MPRLITFGIALYRMLYAHGIAFGWFPAHDTGALVGSNITYLVTIGILRAILTMI